MKILVILTFYRPHWTGLTAHAIAVAEGLAARGHDVTVLTTRHSPHLARDEIINGVRVVRLQPVGRITRTMVTPAFPHAAAKLIAEHDVVQIHTPLAESLLVALLCRALGRPLLMTHHGDLVMPAGALNQFVQHAGFVLLRATARLADAVTSYSRDYADHSALLQPFSNKLHYIYPPVMLPLPTPGAAEAWRAQLGLEDRLLIGFAGRWVEEKGFDSLLEALPLIRQVYPEVHLVYVGERNVVYDNFYERCQPLIAAQQEHITFLGLILDPQQMANFYAMCDLFALPSRTDMMALVQVEAMLCGTPVVASDIPGARVVVRETGFGRLAPPHNPPALARIIIDTLRDRQRYRPVREVVRAVFDTERTLLAYEGLLDHLAHTASAHGRRIEMAQQHAQAALQLVGASASVVKGLAVHGPDRPLRSTSFSAEDRATVERLLQNEADMAFRRRALTLIDYLDLHDGETVLDAGCGMGVYMMLLSRLRNLKLYGVDGDMPRLQWAGREGVRGAFSSADLHHLPFADTMFDKVLMSEVLEHLADDRAALREIYRVLKPGGILALSVPHANYPFWWDPINKSLERLGLAPIQSAGPITGLWSNHWRLYLPHELRSLLIGAGFVIETLEEQTHYAFPFSHFIVYSIGKPLIEHNLLPPFLRNAADRFRGERNSGSLLNPINLGVRLFRMVDARNERLRGDEQTFVNVVAKARKL